MSEIIFEVTEDEVDEFIRDRILDTIRKAGRSGHILNLGHGILPKTPEENARFFFETAKKADELM